MGNIILERQHLETREDCKGFTFRVKIERTLHHVQYTDNTGQGKEVRIGLCEHPFHFIDLGSGSLLLGRVPEPDGHRRVQLEFHEGHGV